MPKSQFVDPKEKRAPSFVHFNDIPCNQYNKTIKEESANYSRADFMRIFRDMAYLREFETMVAAVKTQGIYNGINTTYPGPSHLSLGQEANAVGQSYLLGIDDFIFGTHRSHDEVLAKGLSAIDKLSEDELLKIMKEFLGGATLKAVEGKQKTGSVKDLALDFLFYGMLAELFARKTGFGKGIGGSMHAFFLPFGIYPNNAIVGGSAPIATGAALYKRVNRKKGVIVANAGDGAVGCGPVYESMNFAAMDQYTKLWDDAHKGGLPIIFFFNNNSYGMGGQTVGETMAYEFLARLGAGVTPDQMHVERVDGYNPLAVIDAMRRKKPLAENGDGPVMLDVMTYRQLGHSTSDINSYRTKEEIDTWAAVDPLITYRKSLVDAGVAKDEEFDTIWAEVRERMTKICGLAADKTVSPYLDITGHPEEIESIMFSNLKIDKMEDRPVDVLQKKEENPRVQAIAKKARFALDADGKALPKLKVFNIRDGLFEAIIDKYYTDPTLISYGEDVRDWGGAFAVYRDLEKAIPYHRLFNSPISESAIVGTAVGYGMLGGRAIPELMYCDFMGRAGDEIFNQLAKWQAMSAGFLKMPVVLRVSVGAKYGAQHSQDWTALTAHIPGLKAVFPVTPYDAKGLMNSALAGTDPVVFFESQRIYDIGETFHKGGVPEGYYEIPFGEPDVKREGKDITILTIGATLYRALEAAKQLEAQYGVSAEVIDARSVVPFNYEKVLESVKKTGKILLTSDACQRNSVLNEMARNISELAFDDLDAPPIVVGARNWITPPYEFDADFFPQPSWIIDAIHEKIMPLKGHVASNNYTRLEQERRAAAGV
ncbi:MAG: thiamine pyrophosphate-dependent enzyme [Clostridia bacterium]|nr:thiamine pyrophosphate-dependent enzyme [Clostridia bacterium]